MNIKRNILSLACAGLLSATAQAGEVDDTNVTTFQANTPAVAAEVNTTIGALITAINDNAQRIAALEDTTADAQSVSGHNYRFADMEVGANASTDDRSTLTSIFGYNSVIMFDAAGTGMIVAATETDIIVDTRTYRAFIDPVQQDLITDSQADAFISTGSEQISFTWTQSGETVTIDDGEDTQTFYVAMDGSVLITQNTDMSDIPGYEGGNVNIVVGVRVQ